eukprot:392125-Amphidinium_carterae.1
MDFLDVAIYCLFCFFARVTIGFGLTVNWVGGPEGQEVRTQKKKKKKKKKKMARKTAKLPKVPSGFNTFALQIFHFGFYSVFASDVATLGFVVLVEKEWP